MDKNERNPNASAIDCRQPPKLQRLDRTGQEQVMKRRLAATAQQIARSMVEREMKLTVQEEQAAGGQWHWEPAVKCWRRAVDSQATF